MVVMQRLAEMETEPMSCPCLKVRLVGFGLGASADACHMVYYLASSGTTMWMVASCIAMNYLPV